MNCPSCKKEVVADRFFCTWCEALMPSPDAGTKAGLFRRWFAAMIDPLLGFVLWLIVVVIVGSILGSLEHGVFGSVGLTVFAIFVVTGIYGVYYLKMLAKGTTPGKWLLGMQVVNNENGEFPGLGKMILRETVGKAASGLFFGIGLFWAIFDKDAQAWHDKIAGTVVVKKGATASVTPFPETPESPFVMAAATPAMATAPLEPARRAADRFCTNCGGKNPTTGSFCGHCGSRQ